MRHTLALLLCFAGCGDSQNRQGELNGHCYPNGTCNITLTCVGGVCVARDDASVAAVDGAIDAELDAAIDARPDATPDAVPDAFCDPDATLSAPDGHHNPGMSCIAAGCHLTGQTGVNAPAFTYAGTLYTTAAGTTPLAGATVSITMASLEKKVITASNGNFFMTGAPSGFDAPTNTSTAVVRVGKCPNVPVPMSGALVQGGGNCNNCHKNGGTTSPIHLP